jgi:hypothetical protein
MTTRKFSLIALLLILPLTLHAQRRRGGDAGGGGASAPSADDCGTASTDGRNRGFTAGGGAADAKKMMNCMKDSPSLSKDLQKANPVEFLLDKKKDLAVTKDQEKEIKAINDELKESIKPFLKAIDSVSRENKKTGDYAPTQGQMMMGQQLTRSSVDSVRARYDAAAEAAVGKLSEDHRQAATDMLKQEREEQMRNARGSRGGRPPV